MGRIKNAVVKSIGDNLIEEYSDRFSTNFEKNKKIIDELIDIESKSVRNKISGYVTHEMEKNKKLNTRKISYDAGPSPVKRKKKGKKK